MKKQLSKILLGLCMGLARGILRKYRVKVVGVTGAAGKTGAKEGIYQVLKTEYLTERSRKTLNSPWAVTAAVIHPGIELPINKAGEATISWGRAITLVLEGTLKNIFTEQYPLVLVLELSEDYAGIMKVFGKFLKLDVAVITNLGTAHTEFFDSIEEMKQEQFRITDLLKDNGLLLASLQNSDILPYLDKFRGRSKTYGIGAGDIQANVLSTAGLKVDYEVKCDDQTLKLELPGGRQRILAGLAAIGVGREFAIPLSGMKAVIESVPAMIPGRFSAEVTERGIVLIDDTYNANLDSVLLGLQSLNDISTGRRVVILGGMKELGNHHNASHNIMGKNASELADIIIAIGDESALIADGAKSANFPDSKIFQISWNSINPDVPAATRAVLEILQDGDTVLLKASRGVGLERLLQSLRTELNHGRSTITE